MLYDLIKNKIQISDVVRSKVELKKKGVDYLGLCPFHSEKTPSFTVNDIKRFFYCFGCHAGGDAISFVSQTTGLSYKEAAFKLASDYHIEIPSSAAVKQELDEFEKIYSTLELAQEFYHKSLTPEAISYLNNRGLNKSIIEKFEIGYAPTNMAMRKNLEARGIPLLALDKAGLLAKKDGSLYEVFRDRITFPIRNSHNKIIAFGGRTLKNIQPKYLNSPETLIFKKNEVFYGENFAFTNCYKSNRAILVEGYMDVIKMHVHGFNETVATLGTAVSEKHLEKLWSIVDEIIVCLDGDAAGMRASKRVVEIALPKLKANKYISFVMLPNNYDPDDALKNKGREYMELLIQNRLELSKMVWFLETNNVDLNSAELIAKLEGKLNEYITHIKDNIVAKNYKRFFNDQIWQMGKNKKKSASPHTPLAPTIQAPDNIFEITLIALLMMRPELFDDQDIAASISQMQFSQNYIEFINPKQIKLLESEILPIIQKTNPSFLSGLSKISPKEAFLQMAKKYNLMLLERKYKDLVINDPKKFLEFYNSYKTQINKLMENS